MQTQVSDIKTPQILVLVSSFLMTSLTPGIWSLGESNVSSERNDFQAGTCLGWGKASNILSENAIFTHSPLYNLHCLQRACKDQLQVEDPSPHIPLKLTRVRSLHSPWAGPGSVSGASPGGPFTEVGANIWGNRASHRLPIISCGHCRRV